MTVQRPNLTDSIRDALEFYHARLLELEPAAPKAGLPYSEIAVRVVEYVERELMGSFKEALDGFQLDHGIQPEKLPVPGSKRKAAA